MKEQQYKDFVISSLLDRVPEIIKYSAITSPAYLEECVNEGYTYSLYEIILSDYVCDLLGRDNISDAQKQILQNIFTLVEEMVTHECDDVVNLMEVGFLGSLANRLESIEEVQEYMLPNSLAMMHKLF